MKRIAEKLTFPKVKHCTLCQIILFAPMGTMFYYLIAMLLIYGDRPLTAPLEIFGVFASAAFSLWYLFSNLMMLIFSGVMFSAIRSWRRDLLEYRTNCNGHDRETVRQRILRRCRLWGRRYEIAGSSDIQIFYKNRSPLTYWYSVMEKRVAVCSTAHLTAQNYRVLCGQARNYFRQAPHGKPHFKTKSEKRSPRAYCSVIILLADRVDEEVRKLVRKDVVDKDNQCLLICAVQCPDGKYYLDGSHEYWMMGPRPLRNSTRGLLTRVVFGGRLPREDRSTRLPSAMTQDLDMSLWEMMRQMREGFSEGKEEAEKERKSMLRRLREGETAIGEYAIYHKQNGRMAECGYLADEEDEKLLSLIPADMWYVQRDGFPRIIAKQHMKKQDIKAVQQRIETYLLVEGYRIASE